MAHCTSRVVTTIVEWFHYTPSEFSLDLSVSKLMKELIDEFPKELRKILYSQWSISLKHYRDLIDANRELEGVVCRSDKMNFLN